MTYALSILVALKVALFFIFIYIFIPAQLTRFRDEETFLDRFFMCLIHSNIITIFIVHFLAFTKLYETFSLMFGFFVFYVGYAWIRGRSPVAVADALGMKLVINLLDMSEGRLGLGGELTVRVREWFYQKMAITRGILHNAVMSPFSGLFVLLVLAASAFIRFHHSIVHSYYGASDAYVHLAWMKYLGSNQIYRDGIYAQGYHAVLSALNKLTMVDPYFIIRYVGPLAGFLLVLSVYYFAVKNFNIYIALVAIIFYGIVNDGRFPGDMWRHISALSQEYSAIFLLPGIHFFNLYMKNKSIIHLILAAECLAITLLINPYITVYMITGFFILLVCYPENILKLKFLIKTSLFLIVSIIAGASPMVLGLLMGMGFNPEGYRYVTQSMKGPAVKSASGQIITNILENPFLFMLLFCSILLFIYGIYLVRKGEDKWNERIYLAIPLISLASFAYFRADIIGLPVLVDPWRAGIFAALFSVVAYGAVMNLADCFIKKEAAASMFKKGVTIVVLIGILVLIPIKIPQGARYEYDEAANAYVKIKNLYPVLNWTIIAPVEQYQQCLGFGWHIELMEFAQKVSAAGGPQRDENFSIPTDHVFIFTEKIPLGSEKAVNSEDLHKEIPELVGNPTGFYYSNPENRRILQAKVHYWAENFMKQSADMEIFFDGDYLRIYLLKQDAKKPIKLFASQRQ